MLEKPIKKGSGLFIRGAKSRIAISAITFIGLYGVMIISPVANLFSSDAEAMTARFAMLCFMAVFNGFCIRTEHINLFNGLSKNKLFGEIAIGIFAMAILLCTFVGDLIKVTPLDLSHWLVVILISLMVVPVDIIRKFATKKREYKIKK